MPSADARSNRFICDSRISSACWIEKFLKVCVMPSSVPSVAVTVLERAKEPPKLAPRFTDLETPEVTDAPLDTALPIPLVTALPSDLETALPTMSVVPFAVEVEWEEPWEWFAEMPNWATFGTPNPPEMTPPEDLLVPLESVSVTLSLELLESDVPWLSDWDVDSFDESVSL